MNCCKPDHPNYAYAFPSFPHIGIGKTSSGPPPSFCFLASFAASPLSFTGSGRRFDTTDY
jgi:hypothetical protein